MLMLLALPAFADGAGGFSWKVPPTWKTLQPNPGSVAAYDAGGVQLEVSYLDGTSDFRSIVAAMNAALPDPKPSFRPERVGPNMVVVVQVEANGKKLHGVIFLINRLSGEHALLVFKMLGPKKIVERARAELKKMLYAMTGP
jgi:hypothetical protein